MIVKPRLLVRYETWLEDIKPGLQETWRSIRLLMRSPTAVFGLITLLIQLVLTILGPVLSPYDPIDVNTIDKFKPPSAEHLMGTDELGRDVFSRVIAGAGISLRIGVMVTVIVSIIGVPLGAISGYLGGTVDTIIMRIGDVFLAFPGLVLAIALAASLGGGITNAVIAIAITGWPTYARLIRSSTLTIKQELYIEAARASGTKSWRIITQHILPNCIGPWIVQVTMDLGWAIMTAAALGFIGVGAKPPQPEWGVMVSQGRNYFFDQWWISGFPAIAVFVVVLGYNLLGDTLRDVLDPRMRRR